MTEDKIMEAIISISLLSLILLVLSVVCFLEKEKELAKKIFKSIFAINGFYYFLVVVIGIWG